MMIFVFDMVENIVGKAENAFPLFPQSFLQLSFSGSLAIEITDRKQSTEIIERKEENPGISLFEQTQLILLTFLPLTFLPIVILPLAFLLHTQKLCYSGKEVNKRNILICFSLLYCVGPAQHMDITTYSHQMASQHQMHQTIVDLCMTPDPGVLMSQAPGDTA